ncbi:hypothetical protein EU805_07820 [Salipiger sp. IMCC34102]|uniref:hypothetical protein n=1 Tax=Salipiger sp. IMCC34102 TaxID=2510647 RepID=UPI00101CBB5C|nr:hypothetical protein [Salipiger sp. IMCC34102]RYH02525.1 hypothetical protein EU805_07820 [Salipiger sp. IMCC34102]
MPDGASGPTLDRVLLLIGRINYTWTNTESLLIHLIAGLARTDKESAVVIYLSLNTAKARIDLVERLSKLDRVAKEERREILDLTSRMARIGALRNRLNHSIYAFDPESGQAKTILMRISDRRTEVKMGRNDLMDDRAIEEIESSIRRLESVNRAIWSFIRTYGYPA